MRHRSVVAILALGAGLLFAAVSTAGGVGLWQAPDLEPVPRELPPPRSAEVVEEQVEDPPAEQDPFELPGWIEAVLRVLLVAVLMVAVVVASGQAWEHRPRLRFRRRGTSSGPGIVLPDVGAAVVEDAPTQRAALRHGSPRNAIVRCWLRLEEAVADTGITPDPAETSAELTRRVLVNRAVDAAAIRDLAELYREARFSEHQMGEADREAALAALDRLHDALGAHPRPNEPAS